MDMKSAHIVLIEDNPADVHLVELALREYGIAYSLTRFESGTEAVRVLCSPGAENLCEPDLILMDLNSPRTDGFDALRTLKESLLLTKVPIAILTSSGARTDKQRAERLGTPFIEKPCQLKDFLATVGQAVAEMLKHLEGVEIEAPEMRAKG
jgi:two-component system, chemotaxis family, response regulator Rcp1